MWVCRWPLTPIMLICKEVTGQELLLFFVEVSATVTELIHTLGNHTRMYRTCTNITALYG